MRNYRFRKYFFSLIIVSLLVMPVMAFAQYGLDEAAQKAGLKDTGVTGADDLPSKVGTVLFTFISFVGVIFLVMTIYAGFLWITAGGNTEQTKKASTMLRNGVIGIIIIVISYGLTLFIFDNLVGN